MLNTFNIHLLSFLNSQNKYKFKQNLSEINGEHAITWSMVLISVSKNHNLIKPNKDIIEKYLVFENQKIKLFI